MIKLALQYYIIQYFIRLSQHIRNALKYGTQVQALWKVCFVIWLQKKSQQYAWIAVKENYLSATQEAEQCASISRTEQSGKTSTKKRKETKVQKRKKTWTKESKNLTNLTKRKTKKKSHHCAIGKVRLNWSQPPGMALLESSMMEKQQKKDKWEI